MTNRENDLNLTWTAKKLWGYQGTVYIAEVGNDWKYRIDRQDGAWTVKVWRNGNFVLSRPGFRTLKGAKLFVGMHWDEQVRISSLPQEEVSK